jgi:hypothetical protein
MRHTHAHALTLMHMCARLRSSPPPACGAQLVGSILAAVFVEHGQPNPVPRMRDGDSPAVCLHNWNALQPHLSTFGVNFTSDDKALIVAGGALSRRPSCCRRCLLCCVLGCA